MFLEIKQRKEKYASVIREMILRNVENLNICVMIIIFFVMYVIIRQKNFRLFKRMDF